MLAHDPRSVLVHLARLFPRFSVVAKMNPRSRYRQNRGLNVVLVHQRDGGIDAPFRDRKPTGIETFSSKPFGVRGRHNVMMGIDASESGHFILPTSGELSIRPS